MPVSQGSEYRSSHSVGDSLVSACGDMVVINLPSRRDRRYEFAEQLQQIGLSFDHPRVHLFDAVRPQEAGPFPTIGARGCFLSHLEILRSALEEGAEKILVCEDDLNFAHDIRQRSPYLMAEIERQDWDMLYGFAPAWVEAPTVDGEKQLLLLRPEDIFTCTHIIAFRRQAISLLVPYLEAILSRPAGDPAGGPMHVDGAYHWFRKAYPDLRVIAVRPGIGYQRASMTDVSRPGAIDRLPVVRQMAAFARRLRNRLHAR